MKTWQKLIFVPLIPLALSLSLTVVGLIWGNTPLLAIAGLGLLFPCFLVFAFADRWLIRLQQQRSNKKLSTYLSSFDSTTRALLEFVADLPVGIALLIRGLFLSLSFWIVSLFVGLCQSGLSTFFDAFKTNFVMTLVSLSVSVFEANRGKSVSNPGWPTRLLSTWGFFQFSKGLYLLFAAFLGPTSLKATQVLFSNPVWFLFDFERYQVLRILTDNYGFLLVLMGFGLFQVIGSFESVAVLRRKAAPDNIDPKNFAAAMLILSLWVLPLPIYYAGSFVYFLISTFR